MSDYSNTMIRIKCRVCNIIFFTYYKDKTFCNACDGNNEITKKVNEWSK